MARANIPVQTPAITGDIFMNCTAASATDGDHTNGMEVVNDGRTIIVVKNGDVSARTVTPKGVADENNRIQDVARSIAAGEYGIILLPKTSIWNQGSTGKAYLDQSAGGNAVKYWAFRLP